MDNWINGYLYSGTEPREFVTDEYLCLSFIIDFVEHFVVPLFPDYPSGRPQPKIKNTHHILSLLNKKVVMLICIRY